ncbi:MAG: hypothetical protein PHR53_04560 [Bacteroidales bacterium]|nr:hypothetical protein [Bacteroidales bacterium]
MKKHLFIGLLLLCSCYIADAQYNYKKYSRKGNNDWALSANGGIQIAGVAPSKWQKENIAPYMRIAAEKWLKTAVGLRFGLQGLSFNYVGDHSKHPYVGLFGEAMFNTNYIFNGYNPNRIWLLNLDIGVCFMYDWYKNIPNFCFTGGLTNSFRLTDALYFNFTIASMFGWSIYESNEDLLPSFSVGLTYRFRR